MNNKHSMKKYLITLFVTLSFPLSVVAMVDSDVWSYVFHLEYNQGALSVSPEAKFPYSPVPMEFVPERPSNETDFYGIIYNVKNKEEARFGFMAPTTVNLASGKSAFEVAAPKYADADHVSFYTKANKHLFDVSVKDSSFCNDNNKCDATYGEDYKNCPADCPAPVVPPTPASVEPIMTPTPPTPEPVSITPPSPSNYATSVDTSYVSTSTGTIVQTKSGLDIKTVLSFVGGILFLVLAFFFYRRKKSENVI
jgi:LPXTG-motif cell wall-anchored protein